MRHTFINLQPIGKYSNGKSTSDASRHKGELHFTHSFKEEARGIRRHPKINPK
jgi:hypothetical protein